MSRRLSVLVLTNLFPSNVDPTYAPFNRRQLATLGEMADVEVWGVVPWRFARWSAKGSSSDVVRRERIDGLPVLHPRLPAIPGLPSLNAGLYAATVLPALLSRREKPDVILASYAYPDGCAGVLVGRAVKRPVVVKCHGSDLNRVPNDRAARIQLETLLPRAARVVVVSRRLADRAIELGVPADRLDVVYNGVDRERFFPRDRAAARKKLGRPPNEKLVLFVGHLAEHKGAKDLLEAAERLGEGTTVAFAGAGPLYDTIARAGGRVIALGHLSKERVAEWLAACDLLCLPSWGEGMPNVVREAHAAGRPVVATSVGGIPEAVHSPELGLLVPPKDPVKLAEALSAQLSKGSDPSRITALAEVPTWRESATALLSSLQQAVGS